MDAEELGSWPENPVHPAMEVFFLLMKEKPVSPLSFEFETAKRRRGRPRVRLPTCA